MRPTDTALEHFDCFTLTLYTLRESYRAALLRENQREAVGLIERDSAMSRVSNPSRASAIFVATAASLAAMTAYNIYRARQEKGEGPPVVLLHGNVVTAEDFQTSGVLDLLARRHRVIAFDRPGFGYSDRPHGSAWSARAQADLLRAAFVVLGVDHPVVLGHSFGASVALALALNHPQEVRGLVLVSGYYYPTLRADVLLSSPAAIPLLGDLLRYSISPLLGRMMQPLLLKGMFTPLRVPANFKTGPAPKMSLRPGQIRAESQDGVAMIPGALAMRHRYQELTMPVVIMAGTKDRVVNAKQPRPGVGHMLHYAVTDEVAEAIKEVGGSVTTLDKTQHASFTAAAA